MVAEVSLILMIVQAAIAVHAVEVFLGALISVVGTFVIWGSFLAPYTDSQVSFPESCSYGHWFTFIGIVARSEGNFFIIHFFQDLCWKELIYYISGPHAARRRCLFLWCIPWSRRLVIWALLNTFSAISLQHMVVNVIPDFVIMFPNLLLHCPFEVWNIQALSWISTYWWYLLLLLSCAAETIGIVDYTNYDDMKYAVGLACRLLISFLLMWI